MSRIFAGMTMVAALSFGAALLAQERQPLRPLQGVGGAAAAAPTMAPTDQQIAALIYGVCHNEVEISKFAQEKLQSPQAREFAEKMVREHTPDCETYARLAGNLVTAKHDPARAPAEPPPEGARPATPRPAIPPRVDVEVAPRPGAAPGAPPGVDVTVGGRRPEAFDWVAIHRELGEQCLASTKQELTRKQGPEFDHCFMGQQFGAHMQVADMLKVLKRHASPQLAEQIDKSSQVVQAHLQEARQFMEKSGTPSERVSRKPEGNP